jgi:hypothetical protein
MGTTLYFFFEMMGTPYHEQNNYYYSVWIVIFACMGWMMYLELE